MREHDRERRVKEEASHASQNQNFAAPISTHVKLEESQPPIQSTPASTAKAAEEEASFRRYARFAKPDLLKNFKDWKGDYYMNEAKKLHSTAVELTNQIRVSDCESE